MYLVRLVRSAWIGLRRVLRAETATHARLRDRVVGIALATLAVDLVCSVLALAFERGAQDTEITSFGMALFWTSTQLLTVSSSLANPLTTAGRVLDVAMQAYAITVVAGLAGSLGAFMVKRGHEAEQAAERTVGS